MRTRPDALLMLIESHRRERMFAEYQPSSLWGKHEMGQARQLGFALGYGRGYPLGLERGQREGRISAHQDFALYLATTKLGSLSLYETTILRSVVDEKDLSSLVERLLSLTTAESVRQLLSSFANKLQLTQLCD